jgi:hypothetical protein
MWSMYQGSWAAICVPGYALILLLYYFNELVSTILIIYSGMIYVGSISHFHDLEPVILPTW